MKLFLYALGTNIKKEKYYLNLKKGIKFAVQSTTQIAPSITLRCRENYCYGRSSVFLAAALWKRIKELNNIY